jgi:hypothetical protein
MGTNTLLGWHLEALLDNNNPLPLLRDCFFYNDVLILDRRCTRIHPLRFEQEMILLPWLLYCLTLFFHWEMFVSSPPLFLRLYSTQQKHRRWPRSLPKAASRRREHVFTPRSTSTDPRLYRWNVSPNMHVKVSRRRINWVLVWLSTPLLRSHQWN